MNIPQAKICTLQAVTTQQNCYGNLMRLMLTLILSGLLLLTAASAFANPPNRIQATYHILKAGLKIAQVEEVFTHDKDRYTLTSTTSATGLLALFRPEKIIAHSRGLINKQGLQPEQFDHKRGDDSKDIRAQFNWKNRKLALFLANKQHQNIKLPENTQDRLSAMYQFMFLPLKIGGNLSFYMSNGKKLDDYIYSIERNQKLSTPFGKLDTLYLDSQSKVGETRTQIWLATKYRNLPAKMIVTDDDGDELTQVLSNIIITP